MEAAAKQKDERFTQPFLLTNGADHNPDQYFPIVDRMAIPCGQQLIKSIDSLFKAIMFQRDLCSTPGSVLGIHCLHGLRGNKTMRHEAIRASTWLCVWRR